MKGERICYTRYNIVGLTFNSSLKLDQMCSAWLDDVREPRVRWIQIETWNVHRYLLPPKIAYRGRFHLLKSPFVLPQPPSCNHTLKMDYIYGQSKLSHETQMIFVITQNWFTEVVSNHWKAPPANPRTLRWYKHPSSWALFSKWCFTTRRNRKEIEFERWK